VPSALSELPSTHRCGLWVPRVPLSPRLIRPPTAGQSAVRDLTLPAFARTAGAVAPPLARRGVTRASGCRKAPVPSERRPIGRARACGLLDDPDTTDSMTIARWILDDLGVPTAPATSAPSLHRHTTSVLPSPDLRRARA